MNVSEDLSVQLSIKSSLVRDDIVEEHTKQTA